MTALDRKLHEIERLRTMAIAEAYKALKRVGGNGNVFQAAPVRTRHHNVRGCIVRELVEEGKLAWVNEAKTAAVLAGRA